MIEPLANDRCSTDLLAAELISMPCTGDCMIMSCT